MGMNGIRAKAAAGEVVRLDDDLAPAGPAETEGDGLSASIEKLTEGAAFERNDNGNGRRLALYFGDNLLYVPRLGWHRWDGGKWAADEDAISVRGDAQDLGRYILDEKRFIVMDPADRERLDHWRDVRGEHAQLEQLGRQRDATQDVRFLELEAVRKLGEAAADRIGKVLGKHEAHALNSGNSGKITNMMAEAQVRLAASVTDLNADADMVNTRNGVLRFWLDPSDADAPLSRGGTWRVELLPHERNGVADLNRNLLITKMIAAHYDPNAQAPSFHAFLERVQPDPEIRGLLQRFGGYSLLGRTTEQKLLFNYGIGRNGKSTLVDVLADIFADFGTTLPIESLTGTEQRKGSEATPDLVRLPGARFVRASEPEQGTKMKEALIKALTGGEAILIRRMHAEFVEIQPEFKLWISGNHKPEIRGADDGIWRRVLLVPWNVQIPTDEVDGQLPARLREERDGILAWLVEGALAYLNDGLQVPTSVLAATDEYRMQSDPMREFLMTECRVTGSDGDRIKSTELRDAFNAWMMAQAERPWTTNTVGKRVRDRSGVIKGENGETFEKYRSNGETGFKGLQLKPGALQRVSELVDQIATFNARAN